MKAVLVTASMLWGIYAVHLTIESMHAATIVMEQATISIQHPRG